MKDNTTSFGVCSPLSLGFVAAMNRGRARKKRLKISGSIKASALFNELNQGYYYCYHHYY